MISLRPYKLHDETALIYAINQVCAEGMMATRHFIPTPAWSHALARPDCDCHLLLVVEDDGQVVGWCRLFRDGTPAGAEVGLGLLPPYRRQGWGTSLLERALAWASTHGLEQVWLSTWQENHPAVHLFRKFGFRPTGAWLGREQVMMRSVEIASNSSNSLQHLSESML